MSPADRPCPRFDRSRSELVDGSIGHDERETLLGHLDGCAACRADVVALRRLRDLLHGGRSGAGSPSAGLQGRLVSIADHSDEPLRTRPFSRSGRWGARWGGRMPSRRRRRRRLAAAVTVFGSVLAAAAGVGYAVGPAEARPVADPTDGARAGFAAVRADTPLSSDPATAAMLAAGRVPAGSSTEASLWAAVNPTPSVPPKQPITSTVGAQGLAGSTAAAGRSISPAAAAAALLRAERVAGTLGYQGVEQVVVQTAGRRMTADVEVSVAPTEDTDLTVRSDSGTTITAGSMPAATDDGPDLTDLLADGYVLTGRSGLAVLGRRATVVEARPDGASDGRPTARWWIDQQTGLLLGRQTFEPSGQLIQSSMLTSLALDPGSVTGSQAPRLTSPVAAVLVAPAASGDLTAAGWDCEQTLAGLALSEVRTDDRTNPGLVHLVYTDGVTTLSVVERRGRLSSPPAGSVRDATLDAYLTGGVPLSASWQSGDRVITVVTDGSRDQLAQVVHNLPHEPASTPTTMGRVQAGWRHLATLIFR